MLREKYNPDNLFNKKTSNIEGQPTEIIEIKEPIIKRVIKKL